MSADLAREMEARMNDIEATIDLCYEKLRIKDSITGNNDLEGRNLSKYRKYKSSKYIFSLPYRLLVDALAHRAEQSVISSSIVFMDNKGSPTTEKVNFTSFYHPNYLRCFGWRLGPSTEENLLRGGTSAGLVLSLMLDGNASSLVPVTGHPVASRIFVEADIGPEETRDWHPVHLSDWSMMNLEEGTADRSAGVRVFLTPPGEYPTEFAKSYLLSPGKLHQMELSMTEQRFNSEESPCIEEPTPTVQFLNMYDHTPYTHEYSFSYCYYYEYHKSWQKQMNYSGPASPLPWPLSNKKSYMNFSGPAEEVTERQEACSPNSTEVEDDIPLEKVLEACKGRDRCSLLQYDATISSADWPTQSSLATYLKTVVAASRASAVAKNLSVPALDFLTSASSADAAAYVRANLLKLQIRPSRVQCDRLIYSVQYGLENFIADVGGILGIYLGMSLLTVCELIELIIDVARCSAWKSGEEAEDESEEGDTHPRTVGYARVAPQISESKENLP